MRKRIIALILVLISLTGLTSCDRKYDEEQVKENAQILIEKSIILNEVYWGRGISHIDDAATSNGDYYEANYVHLKALGFQTIDELKTMTKEAFSKRYSEQIFATVLSTVTDGVYVEILPRYYQKYEDEEMKVPESIMVNSEYEAFLLDEVEYLYETINVLYSKGEVVFFEIDVNVTRGDKSQLQKLEIGIIEEKDGWRLYTPTYTTYDEFYGEEGFGTEE